MAAPIRNRMLLIRDANSASLLFRNGKVSIRMISSNRLTLRHISQLHRCSRCHIDVQKASSAGRTYTLSLVRHASTNTQVGIPSAPEIPLPPELPSGFIPDVSQFAVDISLNLPDLNAIGEPTLRSLGLGSNFPPGLFQKALEWVHVSVDIPWWTAIIMSVFVIRLCVFPLMIKQQRSMATHAKYRHTMTKLQNAVDEAKISQDALEIMKKSQELQLFMKDKRMGVIQMGLPMVIQMPIFISAYIGLKKMADFPVESMTEGGFGWVTDLTLTDPFFILPFISGLALLINFEVGAETASAKNSSHAQRWMMRGASGLFLVFSSFLPSGCTLYFATTNIFTLTQASLLRTTAVRNFFKIPARPVLQETDKKGFLEGFKDIIETRNRKKDIVNWRFADEEQFKKAGTGPVPKTYRYNPKAVRASV